MKPDLSFTITAIEPRGAELHVSVLWTAVTDAGERIGQSGDGGIDGIIDEDKLGLDVIHIQAKRWQPGNTI